MLLPLLFFQGLPRALPSRLESAYQALSDTRVSVTFGSTAGTVQSTPAPITGTVMMLMTTTKLTAKK